MAGSVFFGKLADIYWEKTMKVIYYTDSLSHPYTYLELHQAIFYCRRSKFTVPKFPLCLFLHSHRKWARKKSNRGKEQSSIFPIQPQKRIQNHPILSHVIAFPLGKNATKEKTTSKIPRYLLLFQQKMKKLYPNAWISYIFGAWYEG